MNSIKLTQYSHGAGCGCKISPKVLDSILVSSIAPFKDEHLLVGNDSRDDAAVYDFGNGEGIISTTDFFMPIVDDPFTFGKIAATNAISDVYAMGGKPMMSIAILGWPVDKIPTEFAQQVLEGARETCKEAGIVLAGGHSIDSPEPIFGLAVTGRVDLKQMKQNDTAKEGDLLYLTKPLGVGILSTAQKQGKLRPEDAHIAPESMCKLNKIGEELAHISGINAMTDVTGFGLLGHLCEMCQGSALTAKIEKKDIPIFPQVMHYLAQGCIPGGTFRNWESYGCHVKLTNEEDKTLLTDPQTSGGLLIAVSPDAKVEVEALLASQGYATKPLGKMVKQEPFFVEVIGR